MTDHVDAYLAGTPGEPQDAPVGSAGNPLDPSAMYILRHLTSSLEALQRDVGVLADQNRQLRDLISLGILNTTALSGWHMEQAFAFAGIDEDNKEKIESNLRLIMDDSVRKVQETWADVDG